MTTIEFCMMLVMFFLTWHLWRMSKRIGSLELNTEAQWKTIRANRKRIAILEEERDGNGKEDTHDPDRH